MVFFDKTVFTLCSELLIYFIIQGNFNDMIWVKGTQLEMWREGRNSQCKH